MATFVTARPVAWADGVSVNANDLRAGRASLMTPGATSLSPRGGVLPGPGDPGLISALGTPAMKVHVKAASYEVPSSSATGGGYTVVVDADADLDIGASDASNPRTDLLIVEVVDNGDATTTSKVRILPGTAGPGAPRPTNTTPNAHWITIGSVDVRALAESSGFIRAQDVHDERVFAVARGGIPPVAGATERDALVAYEGQVIDRADLDILERYSGAEWRSITGVVTGETSVPVFAVGSGSGTLLAATTLTNPFSGPCVVEAELVGEAAVGANSSARFVLTALTTGRAGWARNFSASTLNFSPNIKARHLTTSGQTVTVSVTVDNVGAGGTSGAAGDMRVQWSIRPAR